MAEADVSRVAVQRPSAAAGPGPQGWGRRGRVTAIQVATFLAMWAGWETLSRSGLLYEGVVPSSFAVLAALGHDLVDASFWGNVGFTGYEVVTGFAIGVGVGVATGLLLGLRRFLAAVLEPFINYMAATPKIVFLPILMVMFGVGPGSKIAMAAISTFFPVALSVYRGALQVNPVLVKVARSFKASQWRIVRSIYLPSLVPPLLTGLKLGLGVSIVGALLAEIKLSNKGLGYVVIQHYNFFRTADMYAVLIIVFALAVAINAIMDRIAQRWSYKPI